MGLDRRTTGAWLSVLLLGTPGLALAQGASATEPAPPLTPADVATAAPVTTSPSAAPAAVPPPPTPAAPPPAGHFEFGSYGRIRIASDGQGGTGRQANIITHGTRIDEESYAELELRREDTFMDDIQSKVVATLALFPPFFHFSGDATQDIALRNLYAQATYGAYTLWVGSRMYRGDDIYLLDWWPLDNQNTVGGGIGIDLPPAFGETRVAAHVGMQRLDNAYQYQQIPVVVPFSLGTTQVTKLDRPRVIETLKLTHLLRNGKARHVFDDDKVGFKFILYGEAHEISAGVAQDPNTQKDKGLPSDTGFVVGGELGYWSGVLDTYVQLFARHARGLAAYDPLASPSTFANDKSTSGSTETLLALGANYETGMVGLLVGGYVRFFRDGDPSPTSLQKYDEGTLVLRPQLYFGEHFGLALEGSFQERRFALLDPSTDAALTASEWRGGVIPFFSPSGRGSYKRPQFRLLYAVTARDSGARSLYPSQDVFAQRKVEHFIGLGVEWWFNSSSYP